MSPESTEAPFETYFRNLMFRLGAKGIDCSTNPDRPGKLIMTANLPTVKTGTAVMIGPDLVRIDIPISRAKGNFWVVETMIVWAQNGLSVVSGQELLAHYGKRVADQYSDFGSEPCSQTWTLRTPRDLEALLVAYDNLATEWGKPLLFGH